jgi:transposase, IS30 family
MKHTKLTKKERELLSQWKKERLSNKECGRRLSRHVSTIGRELKRNNTRVTVGDNDWQIIYEPVHAQHVAEERKQNAWFAKQPLKSKKIYSYVLEKLKDSWSPEQIAGRLREVDHPGDPSWHICHETIYQFIYRKKSEYTKQGLLQQSVLDKRVLGKEKTVVTVTDAERPLWEYLRRKQVRRRKRSGRKAQRVRIPDRVSIHTRPKRIDERSEFGHWEGDSIVGRNHASGLHTEYERVTSFIRFERLERITAAQAALAAQTIFGHLPEHARRSTTLDNGSEHVHHKAFGLTTYFADPYSSYQRGGNENANLWIRYYFPKRTDFSTITEEELKDVEWELNNRPRKRLNFRTPQEVFTEYLNLP